MALNIIPFSSLTGGTDDSYLDYFDGNDLSDGQFAFGIVNGIQYTYVLDASSGASENSPYVISPDTNAGTKRWILQVPGGAFSHVYAKRTISNQTITDATETVVAWDTEYRDTLSEFNTSTGVFTAKYAGIYQISAQVLTENISWSSTNLLYMGVRIESSEVIRGPRETAKNSVTMRLSARVFGSVELDAAEDLDITVYISRGSNTDLQGSTWANYLTIERIA